MNIDAVYTIVKYCVAKNLQDGYVSPDDFNNAMNTAQVQYFDYLLGEYQKYQPGRPMSPVSFSVNEKVRTSLAPLIYGVVLNPNVSGVASFPSDFEQVDAMWSLYGFYNIRFVQQDRQSSYYRSVIDPIQTNPTYSLKHEGFQFYPENIGTARMSYVRTPPGMYWRYTLDSNQLPVYDPIASVDPIWSANDIFNVITRALLIVGTNLQFQQVMQYANEVKQAGQ